MLVEIYEKYPKESIVQVTVINTNRVEEGHVQQSKEMLDVA